MNNKTKTKKMDKSLRRLIQKRIVKAQLTILRIKKVHKIKIIQKSK